MSSSSAPDAGTLEGGRRPNRMWIVVLAAVLVAAAAFGVGYYLLGRPVPTNQPPIAVIHASNSAPVTYDTVTFNATGSSDPDGDALTYRWGLPNGTASSRAIVNYTFTSVGTFDFRLTVTDSHGLGDNATLAVTVRPAPLVVGTNTPYPPFEDYNVSTGQIEGFDVDLADALAAREGYAPQWKNYADFSVLLTTVGSGGVDMAAAAITSSGTVGALRNQSMYFSDPYFVVSLGALVNNTSNLSCALSVCTPMDLANRTIGVMTGSTAEAWVQDHLVATNLTPGSLVMSYTSATTAVEALRTGTVSVVLIESYVAQAIASAGVGQRVAGYIVTGEQYSFAFPHSAAGLVLRARMDAALAWAMQTGVYQNLYKKWFGP